MFLPVAGSPNLTMVLNIAANVMNLILDVIYIRFFHMSVAGAALSTLTSFSAAGLTVLILLPKTRLRAAKPVLSHLLPAAGKGAAASLTQIGYTVKFGFCIMMVTLYGGASGMIVLCTEEMAVYTRQHAKKGDWINLMLKTDGKQAILDFRSLGDPIDLGKFGEGDIEENFRVLR